MGEMLAGARLGEQKKYMVQRISVRNAFKTREVEPFIVLIFWVWVQMSYWRRQKGKQQEKQAT